MSIQDLVESASSHGIALLCFFLTLPILAFLLGRRGKGRQRPVGSWRYAYSALVYASCIPGMLALVITAYALFFMGQNLLAVDAVVHFLPVVSMLVTVAIVRRGVDLEHVPGSDRLWALMLLMGVSFGIALAVMKTRLWIFFGGSIFTLLAFAAFAFIILKWATHVLFRQSGDATGDFPSMPDELEPR